MLTVFLVISGWKSVLVPVTASGSQRSHRIIIPAVPGKVKIDGFIISGRNHSSMDTSVMESENENTYLTLFLLGAIILVFSLYLNVYFIFKAVLL
jgi:hypothetical protein